jgi:hypothetical protein
MIKKDGTWRWAGNGRIAKLDFFAQESYRPYDSVTHIYTGLSLGIKANQPAAAAVQSAIVTGPGLPSGGVILNKQIENDNLAISGEGSLFAITDDAMIDAIPDNAEYIIQLMNETDGAGTVLATYTEIIPKRPLKLSELSSASFPTITTPTVTTLRAFNGGDLTVTWTLPSGLTSAEVELDLSNSTNSIEVGTDLSATDTTITLTIDTPSFTVTNRSLYLYAHDAYARSFHIGIW